MALVNCLWMLVQYSLNTHESQRTNPGKTPIQILHEYGTKSGNLPVYVMEKAEGEAHQPSFVFSVKIGDVSCAGKLQPPPAVLIVACHWMKPFYLRKPDADNLERALQPAKYYHFCFVVSCCSILLNISSICLVLRYLTSGIEQCRSSEEDEKLKLQSCQCRGDEK